ncbi:MAG TPA: hypothetical protein DEP66_06595 [Acidimicrobiaceae bacterium]|nr:hypothetical protein [Acidimicrobiaceae bacterium]
MSDQLDPSEVIARFAERADAVRKRNLPAVGGAERRHFIEQAEHDFMDYSLIAAADATLVDGVLTLRVDLRAGSAAAADEAGEGAKGDDA